MLRAAVSRYLGNSKIIFKNNKKSKEVKSKEQIIKNDDFDINTFQSVEEKLSYKRDYQKSFIGNYNPTTVEQFWDEWWQKEGYNGLPKSSDSASLKPFNIILPPPNVTGSLHIGHALTVSIEDCLARYHRMRGYAVSFIPGVDHAGIATQVIVEKNLMKEGISREQLGRDEFVRKVWGWKELYGGRIETQLKKLGASLDWDRKTFTLDQDRSLAVERAFIELYEKGLIYRAGRLVNWSCHLQTVISDIEVDMMEVKGRTLYKVPSDSEPAEIGVMCDFCYKVKETGEELIISTTRLETMLGDVAVAVHSSDKRYSHLIGKELEHPFFENRKLKIIADDILVDPNFGTGVVKVTPAHDPNDFECGMRHGLQFIDLLTDDGKMNDNCGQFKGMGRYSARKAVESKLTELGLFKGKKPHNMSLGKCSRSGDIIEPIVKPQWYVNCKEAKEKMLSIVKNGDLKIIPESQMNVWNHWMNNMNDWCISRQLWWGHRIPAYRILDNSSRKFVIKENKEELWLIGEPAEIKHKMEELGLNDECFELVRDEDVLDTWFSSALLPFSNFGWPKTSESDLSRFFPNSILETGYDILFFWVARMVMMSLYLTNKLPFHIVLLHSLIRDENREKMSKSKGNVVDPLDIIEGCSLEKLLTAVQESLLSETEKKKTIQQKKRSFPTGIPSCGADSLRFSLLSLVTENKDINFDIKVTIGYRQFCNKMWNGFKLFMMILGERKSIDRSIESNLEIPEQWIVCCFNKMIAQVSTGIESYRFADATEAFNQFWVTCLCDVYLEYSKWANKSLKNWNGVQTLFSVIEGSLRAVHPMLPFLSEELYQKLPFWSAKKSSIMIESYPSPLNFESLHTDFEVINKTVSVLRQLLGILNLTPNKTTQFYLHLNQNAHFKEELLNQYLDYIAFVCKVATPMIVAPQSIPQRSLKRAVDLDITAYLRVDDCSRVGEEVFRLEKNTKELFSLIDKIEKKRGKEDYFVRVPLAIQDQDKSSLVMYKSQHLALEETLAMLKELQIN